MLTTADFITLPFEPSLTQAGLAYALRSVAFCRTHPDPDTLRRLIVEKACELAFRRHLDAQQVPYILSQVVDPLSPQILLNGSRCDLQVTLVNERHEIQRYLREPELLLKEPLKVPNKEGDQEEDILIFTQALGLIGHNEEETQLAIQAGHPAALFTPLPPSWASNQVGLGNGTLVMKSEAKSPVEITIAGLDASLTFQEEKITLFPLERTWVKKKFHTLAYFLCDKPLDGRIGISNPKRREALVFKPQQWHNVWIYGMKILIAGAAHRRDYRKLGREQGKRLSETNNRLFQAVAGELMPVEDFYPDIRS